MRVALLSHLASATAPTGAERSLALLATGLAAREHEVAVVAPGRWALGDELGSAAVPVATIPVRPCWLVQWGPQPVWRQVSRGLRYAMPDLGARMLTRWLDEFRPDVVHVNCLPHLRGAAAARSLGLPVVWHIREMLPAGRRRRWFAERLRSDATTIVAVSEAVASWLYDEGLGDRVEVVHNGVSPAVDADNGRMVRAGLGVPREAVVVGLFSQLVVHKGALDLVRAAHAAVARNEGLHFVIAGHGPTSFADQLAREIAAGPARDQIHVVPPQQGIWGLLAAVDMLALPTRWPDPLPRSVMEAMAAARPVVAYADGGVPEMVVDGETGLLCKSGDVEGLVRAIVELAGDEGLRHRMGSAGKRRALELFSTERYVAQMERILQGSI
jgi:glycosyltransferase involved in cell wall biosynthesis